MNSLQRTASWVIVDKASGKAVFETFNESTAQAINTRKYVAMPIQQWLASLNKAA